MLVVAATVAPITSIAANVGGDRVELTGIVPEGTNSHTFEPPPQVSRVLSRADVVLVNGLKLEDPTLELAEENTRDDALVVQIGDAVLVMDNGKIIHRGDMADLANDTALQERLLGLSLEAHQ